MNPGEHSSLTPPLKAQDERGDAFGTPQAQKFLNLGWAFLVALSAMSSLPPVSINDWAKVLAAPMLALVWFLQRDRLYFAQWFPVYMMARVAADVADELRSGTPLNWINMFFLAVMVALVVYVWSPAGRQAIRHG